MAPAPTLVFVHSTLTRNLRFSILKRGLYLRRDMSQTLILPGPADKPLTKQQELILNHILTTGEPIQVAADSLGMDRCNIYRTLRKPHVKKELRRRTLEHIGILAPYAARCQEELLQSESDHVRATVADSILNRHLGKPVERKQIAFQGQINVSIDLS